VGEWLRGHLFTGFPWNSPGMALGQHLWLLQAASVVGLYGLTLLACLIGAAPALLGTGAPRDGPAGRARRAGLALALLLGYGALRVPGDGLPALPACACA
jgi:apolipoprotein N-acyltransferase